MKQLFKTLLLVTIIFSNFIACTQQKPQKPQPQKLVGGPCEGCEALFEYGDKPLNDMDSVPGFDEYLPQLEITGKVFLPDGITPAENIILYIYQTNREGIYQPTADAKGWAARHGQHRAWVKTNQSGEYTFYTFRPGAYPNRREVEHIHLTVKEPDTNPYYLDSFVFDDDPLLTTEKRNKNKNRGGSGILILHNEKGRLLAKRDIVLGLNIPNHNAVNPQKAFSDTLDIDLLTSTIRWKGTKLKGLGKHEGKVSLHSAYFLKNKTTITGGKFTIDMQSINVTDIPAHEPIPRKNLINHLKSDEFFAVDKHPFASFEILQTNSLPNDSLRIDGQLTIKKIPKPITFYATQVNDTFNANFRIDGFRWNIAYSESWIGKAIIDREIEFWLSIKVKK